MKNLELCYLSEFNDSLALRNKNTGKLAAFDEADEFIKELLKHLDVLKGGDAKYSKAYKELIEKALELVDKEELAKYIWSKEKDSENPLRITGMDFYKTSKLCDLHVEIVDTEKSSGKDYTVKAHIKHILKHYVFWCILNHKHCNRALIEELSWSVDNVESMIEYSDNYLVDLAELEELDEEKYIHIDSSYLSIPYNEWLFSLMSKEVSKNAQKEYEKSQNLIDCPNLLIGLTEIIDRMLIDFSE